MKIRQGDPMKRFLSIFGFACLAWAAGPDLDRANKLYNLTQFQQSLDVLQALGNKDAAVYELMGRDYYWLAEFKKATEALEKAVALEPGNSGFHLWLGRAYGRRAETSSMISAPGLANKARQSFERAVRSEGGSARTRQFRIPSVVGPRLRTACRDFQHDFGARIGQ